MPLRIPLGPAGVEPLEITVGIERGHAACACGGDRLTVDMIGDITGCENARHARRRRIPGKAAVHDNVATAGVELSGEERGIGRMSNGDEKSCYCKLACAAVCDVI